MKVSAYNTFCMIKRAAGIVTHNWRNGNIPATLIGAGLGGGLGYLLNRDKKSRLWTALAGAGIGGLGGYGVNQLRLNYYAQPKKELARQPEAPARNSTVNTNKPVVVSDTKVQPEKGSKQQYITTPQANGIIYGGVKPEFGYILNLADVLENNVNTAHEGNIDVSSAAPNQIAYLRELAVRASLEPGKPGYISPDRLQSELSPYYDAYNGVERHSNGNERVSPYAHLVLGQGDVESGTVTNVPAYPLEGVDYDASPGMKAFDIMNRNVDRRWSTVGTENGKTFYHNEEPFQLKRNNNN